MDIRPANYTTHHSFDVISEIFRNEEASLLLQTYPTEVVKCVANEIESFINNFAYYAREYQDVETFSEHDTVKLFKHKLRMEYYALCYLQASKNLYLYKAYRWFLVEELAVSYNGIYDVIPANVIERLSDEEATHLRDFCEKVAASVRSLKSSNYSLIAIIEDIVTEDIADKASKVTKFYARGTKLIISTAMADTLRHSNWIKIISADI